MAIIVQKIKWNKGGTIRLGGKKSFFIFNIVNICEYLFVAPPCVGRLILISLSFLSFRGVGGRTNQKSVCNGFLLLFCFSL